MSDESTTPPTPAFPADIEDESKPDLTVAEVAAFLRVNPQTVREMIKDGRLKGYRIGIDYRVTRAALNAFRGLST